RMADMKAHETLTYGYVAVFLLGDALYSRPRRDDLLGVENIVGVESTLQGSHEIKRIPTVLRFHKAHFVEAYTVLAGACSPHLDGSLHQASVERLGLFELSRIIRVQQHEYVELAITHVSHNLVGKFGCVEFFRGFCDTLSQTRNRNTDVSGAGSTPWT